MSKNSTRLRWALLIAFLLHLALAWNFMPDLRQKMAVAIAPQPEVFEFTPPGQLAMAEPSSSSAAAKSEPEVKVTPIEKVQPLTVAPTPEFDSAVALPRVVDRPVVSAPVIALQKAVVLPTAPKAPILATKAAKTLPQVFAAPVAKPVEIAKLEPVAPKAVEKPKPIVPVEKPKPIATPPVEKPKAVAKQEKPQPEPKKATKPVESTQVAQLATPEKPAPKPIVQDKPAKPPVVKAEKPEPKKAPVLVPEKASSLTKPEPAPSVAKAETPPKAPAVAAYDYATVAEVPMPRFKPMPAAPLRAAASPAPEAGTKPKGKKGGKGQAAIKAYLPPSVPLLTAAGPRISVGLMSLPKSLSKPSAVVAPVYLPERPRSVEVPDQAAFASPIAALLPTIAAPAIDLEPKPSVREVEIYPETLRIEDDPAVDKVVAEAVSAANVSAGQQVSAPAAATLRPKILPAPTPIAPPAAMVPQADSSNSAAVRQAYLGEVAEKLRNANTRVLAGALKAGAKRRVNIRFEVNRQGGIIRAKPVGTPAQALVQQALKVLQAAAPFPSIPEDMPQSSLELNFPIDVYEGKS